MGDAIRFAAVNSKVKSLEGKLLDESDYMNLIQCRSLCDVLKYLKEETAYSEVLKDYDVEQLHRGKLEIILKKSFVQKLNRLRHYFYGDYRKLFSIMFMKYEIEDLKVILRGKYIGREREYISSLITYESPLNSMDYSELLNARDVEDFVDKLKDTKYHKFLKPLMPYVQQEGLFRLETTLDFAYFSTLRKYVKRLDKESMEIMKKITGTYADMLNIEWIIRGKTYYGLSPEELFNYTIYDGYHLKREILKKMCYAKNQEELGEIARDTEYAGMFEGMEGEHLMGKQMLTCLRGMFNKYRRENRLDVSVVISYLELLSIEIRDITSIVENKRYGIESEKTLSYLTLNLK